MGLNSLFFKYPRSHPNYKLNQRLSFLTLETDDRVRTGEKRAQGKKKAPISFLIKFELFEKIWSRFSE